MGQKKAKTGHVGRIKPKDQKNKVSSPIQIEGGKRPTEE
jgi:hypothetical protein